MNFNYQRFNEGSQILWPISSPAPICISGSNFTQGYLIYAERNQNLNMEVGLRGEYTQVDTYPL